MKSAPVPLCPPQIPMTRYGIKFMQWETNAWQTELEHGCHLAFIDCPSFIPWLSVWLTLFILLSRYDTTITHCSLLFNYSHFWHQLSYIHDNTTNMELSSREAIPCEVNSIVSQHFMEPEGSLPPSQELSTLLSILSHTNPVHATTSHLSRIHPHTSWSS
jgi:hypothetical protein